MPPSVITPRSANETKRAKQLSGIASASSRSRFIADIPGFAPNGIIIRCLRGTINKRMIKLRRAIPANAERAARQHIVGQRRVNRGEVIELGALTVVRLSEHAERREYAACRSLLKWADPAQARGLTAGARSGTLGDLSGGQPRVHQT